MPFQTASCPYLFFNDAEDVFFAHHQQLFAVGFYGLAAVFAEDDFVADFDIQRTARAVFTDFARAHGDDFAHIGFFGGRTRQNDARCGFLFSFQAFDDDAVV
ncbi:hypothetical protein NM69155_2157 [Neisseria meningitidis 69155]|nr:hypothetical protein NM69155_2157 [Neisseria meningitidis 69155]